MSVDMEALMFRTGLYLHQENCTFINHVDQQHHLPPCLTHRMFLQVVLRLGTSFIFRPDGIGPNDPEPF